MLTILSKSKVPVATPHHHQHRRMMMMMMKMGGGCGVQHRLIVAALVIVICPCLIYFASHGDDPPWIPTKHSDGARVRTKNVTATVPHHHHHPPPPHRLRVLFGIFTADFTIEEMYRKRHRDLLALWNDDRVCALHDFKQRSAAERQPCELIYTFVMGANPNATTELVDDSIRPLEIVTRPVAHAIGTDVNHPDTTLLNIRENMNDGKSQSYLYWASQIATRYDLDYITKCDSDSIISLHDFFRFAYVNMPPAPHNSMMFLGIPWNKDHWRKNKHTEVEERYFQESYNKVHIYISGQLYTMSTDLAVAVGVEAQSLNGTCDYCFQTEDHDVSSMAFHNPKPIKLVMLGWHHRYWEHDIKSGTSEFDRIWAREQARMAGRPYEGRNYTTQSSYEDVMAAAETHGDVK